MFKVFCEYRGRRSNPAVVLWCWHLCRGRSYVVAGLRRAEQYLYHTAATVQQYNTVAVDIARDDTPTPDKHEICCRDKTQR